MGHTMTKAKTALTSKNLFISGGPGIGKTKLLRDLALAKKLRIGGFYTEPIMAGRMRKGLIIRTLDGQDRMLASKTVKSNFKLGKFNVDINALENVGIPALKLGMMSKELIVIDEVGTLEAMSTRYKETLLEVLNSTKPVLATLPAKANPFINSLKKIPDTEIIVLKKANFASIKQQVRKWLEGHL